MKYLIRAKRPDADDERHAAAHARYGRFDRTQPFLSRQISLGAQSTISLVSSDGIILMRQPSSDGFGDVGRDVSLSPNYIALKDQREGTLLATTSIDNVERLISFGQVPGHPLRVNVSLATADILADWRREALRIGGISLCVGLAIAFLALTLQRKIDELQEAQAALSEIAATDALTGLPNRREFDAFLRREWQRALRERTPLSVLIIDADQFKQVNDRYGHAEGDAVLKQLANQISCKLMRATDIAARYGGEEFAVILPNTDGPGALKVAEDIRRSVQSWREAAFRNGRPGVTVSVGAATIVPDFASSLDRLLASADAALYQAKADGRNQSQMAEPIGKDPAVVSVPMRLKRGGSQLGQGPETRMARES